MSLREWEERSKSDKLHADDVMNKSNQQREVNSHVANTVKNSVNTQADAVDFGLRKRSNELQAALDELEWQKKQTQEEMAALEEEIRRQEHAIKMNINPSKLAQTRLENRTERPNHELCLDAPYYGLSDEVWCWWLWWLNGCTVEDCSGGDCSGGDCNGDDFEVVVVVFMVVNSKFKWVIWQESE